MRVKICISRGLSFRCGVGSAGEPMLAHSSSATAGAMYFWPLPASLTARISSSGGAVLER